MHEGMVRLCDRWSKPMQQVLKEGGVDAAITFELNGGYELLMSFFNDSFCSSVAAVLQSSGCCQMYSPGLTKTPQNGSVSSSTEASQTACTTSAASVSRGRLRLRWPAWVLRRLSRAALDGLIIANQDEPQSTAAQCK